MAEIFLDCFFSVPRKKPIRREKLNCKQQVSVKLVSGFVVCLSVMMFPVNG